MCITIFLIPITGTTIEYATITWIERRKTNAPFRR